MERVSSRARAIISKKGTLRAAWPRHAALQCSEGLPRWSLIVTHCPSKPGKVPKRGRFSAAYIHTATAPRCLKSDLCIQTAPARLLQVCVCVC